jgi:hypothetical protein
MRGTEPQSDLHGQRQELDRIIEQVLVMLRAGSTGEQTGKNQAKKTRSEHLFGMKVQR